MWNDPPGKGFFRRLITWERCGHIVAWQLIVRMRRLGWEWEKGGGKDLGLAGAFV